MLLRQLEYLKALDSERHFGRASQVCHVSQPALSAALSRLEDELGVELVRRGRRFEGFTPEGERVLIWARRMLADADGLEQEVQRLRGGLEGSLRIGAIPTSLAATVQISARFRGRHPRMRVEIRSLTSREIAAGLRAGTLDAGLTYLENEPLENVHTLPLWREHYYLVHRDGPDIGSIGWARASGLPLGLLTQDMQHRRIVDDAFAAAGTEARPVIETNSVSTLIGHARTGLPVVAADTWLLANPLVPGTRTIPLVDPVIQQPIGLVTHAAAHEPPVVAELMASFAAYELDAYSERVAPQDHTLPWPVSPSA